MLGLVDNSLEFQMGFDNLAVETQTYTDEIFSHFNIGSC